MIKKVSKSFSIDLAVVVENINSQFKNLDRKDPSLWPILPRTLLCVAILIITTVAIWYFYLSSFEEDFTREQSIENALRSEYENKLVKAASLEGLKKQREQVQQYVMQLEKQLPNKAEMAALLSDINQAGLGRSLQFELFKPGSEVVKEYYAELPISVKISGQFHDVGMFAADIANLSRIVTLNNIDINPRASGGGLMLDAVVRTYRYLDPHETKEQEKVKRGGKK